MGYLKTHTQKLMVFYPKGYHQNQIFYYARSIMPKRVTSLQCSSPRHSTKAA